MKASRLSLSTVSFLVLALAGCSTSTTNNNDGGNNATCTDMTGNANPTVTVTGVGGTYPTYSFSPACVQINKGQSVTFNQNFSLHPLERTTQTVSGAANPLPANAYTGTSPQVYTFTASGDFNFECTVHLFTGTIRVN